MKIVWISSWHPRACGIASYSNDYIASLKNAGLDIEVISHIDAQSQSGEKVYPIIDLKSEQWPEKTFEIIEKINPDVIHIQHEYGLYRGSNDAKNEKLIHLLDLIKSKNFPIVITYHSVYKKLNDEQTWFVGESLKRVDAGIVHCQYQKDALPENLGWKPDNVFVIPHGSREGIKLKRDVYKKFFGYQNKNVVGTAGLAERKKGIDKLIKIWPLIAEKLPNTTLAIMLKPHFDKYQSLEYISSLLDQIANNPKRDSIEIMIKNYGEEEFYHELRSFDLLVLPYLFESQSGTLARAFAVGTPVVVNDVEGLGAEVKKSKAGIAVKNDEEMKNAIINLMKSDSKRKKMEKNAKKYVREYCGWGIVAKKTMDIYNSCKKNKKN